MHKETDYKRLYENEVEMSKTYLKGKLELEEQLKEIRVPNILMKISNHLADISKNIEDSKKFYINLKT